MHGCPHWPGSETTKMLTRDSRPCNWWKVVIQIFFVSGKIATVTGDKARHIRDRGFDKQYYQDMILELIREHGPVSRKDIDSLLMGKLPEILSEKQKRSKIHNLLYELSGPLKSIRNTGYKRKPAWVIRSSFFAKSKTKNNTNKGLKKLF